MTSSDDLRKALASLAAEDITEVIEEARAGARFRARELIEDALVEELAAAAGTTRAPSEPRPAIRGTALWAYCVLAAGDAGSLPRIEGVEPDSAIDVVVEGDLAAVVSEVPLTEYGDERLREHLNDIVWVERTARRHEAVLDSMLEHCTIVPLRLCTLFHDRDGVRRLLRDDHATLRAGLHALEGRAEWGLKLFADPSRLQTSQEDEGLGAGSEGVGYLNRKQRERDARAAGDELLSRRATEAHERLAQVADAAHANPVQRREAHGRDAEMVLNGVYLVRRDRQDELAQVVEELRREWVHDGFELDLTGPWPGYNFVAGPEPVRQ